MIILGIDPGIATVGWGVVEYKNTRFFDAWLRCDHHGGRTQGR